MNPVEAALAYARKGWAVFPVHTPTPAGGCSCRKPECTNVGKHPRTMHGLSDASSDPITIERWWSLWPDANVGIACAPSGLVALDIDPRHGGDVSLDILTANYGKGIFDTVTALTGGGGTHLIYQAPGSPIGDVANSDRFTGPLGPGIDVRARGYIVAPPSLHESGAFYEWETEWGPDDREPAPLPPVLEEILLPPPISRERTDRVDIAETLSGVPEGERDWRLFLLAAKCRGADLPIEWAYKLLGEAAANCVPPFDLREARKKVDSAYRYPAGKTAYEAAQKAEQGGPSALLDLRMLLDESIATGVQKPDWLIEDVLVRGMVHTVFGEPESGKTIIAQHWIREVAEQGHTIAFFDEESGIRTVAERFAAMQVGPLDERLYYFPFPGLDLPNFEINLAAIDELRPALIVFDSLTDLLAASGLDENKGIDVTVWMKAVAETLAKRDYAPAVVLIDHIAKDNGNVNYSVGSRAKKAKSDVQWFVQKIAPFDRLRTSRVSLIRRKNRPGVLPPQVDYIVGGRDGRLVVEPVEAQPEEIGEGAAEMLDIITSSNDSVTNQQIRERHSTYPSRSTVQKWGQELEAKGLITRFGEGREFRYRTADSAVIRQSSAVPREERGTADSEPHTPYGGGANRQSASGQQFSPETREQRKERLRAID